MKLLEQEMRMLEDFHKEYQNEKSMIEWVERKLAYIYLAINRPVKKHKRVTVVSRMNDN